jgi:hypothetical protein
VRIRFGCGLDSRIYGIWYFLVKIHSAKHFTNSRYDFAVQYCLRMNTHTAHKLVFTPANLLWNWHKRQPSNQDDLEFSITGTDYDTRVGLFLISVLYRNTPYFWGCFKWNTLHVRACTHAHPQSGPPNFTASNNSLILTQTKECSK